MKVVDAVSKVAKDKKRFRTSDVIRALGGYISRQYVSSELSKLYKSKKLVRAGSGQYVYYALPEYAYTLKNEVRKKLKNFELKEHEVLDNLKNEPPFAVKLRENVKSIFDYAFSEMLNNAIEHSGSKWIDVSVQREKGDVKFVVRDYGIGVFRNVMQKRGLNSELEAIQDILKGKTTTMPHSHTGEGIFFTSRVADIFTLDSFNFRLLVDNIIKDVFVQEIKSVRGTRVQFQISLDSKNHLNDVFKQFTGAKTQYAFDKTEVHIKLYTIGTVYISRSQARRVLTGLDKFKLVILDFDKVSTVGQAFADEIFRVFAQKYPEVEMRPINMNEAVKFMVERVDKPQLSLDNEALNR